jgi:hypothetical protein
MGILATRLPRAAQLPACARRSSGRHADAAEIAQSQVEVFQRMDFQDSALNATAGWDPPGGSQVDRSVQTPGAPIVDQSYSMQWRIVNGPLVSGRVFLKTIDVQVTWDEPNRPGRSYTMTTMRHNDARSAK